jgi:hypothetical protein
MVGIPLLFACGRQGFYETPCQDVVCSGHGTCVVLDDAARCVCDRGYHSEGLECVRDSAGLCEGVDCSGHGRCVLLGGAAQCICDAGYQNDGPTACVVETTVCDGIDCSGHGTCGVTADGSPICSCLTGYHNDGPTTCVPDPGSGKCGTEKDCDDSNQCTTDICTAEGECQNEFNTDPCDDGLYCTDGDVCDGAGNCVSGGQRDCSGVAGECQVGVCNELAGQCEGQPAPDGTECGATYCDGLLWNRQTCQAGVCAGSELVQGCDDGDDCTADSCDPVAGCANPAGPDGSECGARSCSGLDWMRSTCQSGACTGSELVQSCDDGNACSADTCDAAAGCGSTPVADGAECGTRYCDGLDYKRRICQGGVCVGSELLSNCVDTEECTTDLCDPAGCSNPPVSDGTECGSRYCNGLAWTQETCQSGTCSGTAQVQNCDDSNVCTDDSCDPAAGCSSVDNTAACDDSDACTMNDTCSGGTCTGMPLDSDGDTYVSDACGGADCNDSDGNIHPGVFEGPQGAPICSDNIDNDCDTLTDLNDDTCQQCIQDSDCDDNDVCNGAEVCVSNNCVAGTPLICDDGVYCNGAETCDPALGCQAASNPCPETDCNHCNETDGSCFDPVGTACLDDGQYCTGLETCDGAGTCASAGDPCPDTECNHCNETDDSCFDPVGTACLDDGRYCTGLETCDGAGTCGSAGDPCPGTECNHCNEAENNCFDAAGTACTDDGTYCNGPERCDGAGACTGAGNPCPETDCNHCNETDGSCFDPVGTACLDDGLYCTGPESCDGSGSCASSGDPCPGTECNNCNEAADSCFDPAGTACTDDGQYCTGAETCDGAGACTSAGNPCPETMCNTCQEVAQSCYDSAGTGCDDGLYCTLTDTCDGAGSCEGSGSPCQANEICRESLDVCELSGCTGQPDCTPCNDGLYCTANDGCIEGECLGFGDPCAAGEICNETTDSCEAQCATNCSFLDDACNTGVCNPQSGQCELQPKPIGTACATDGGDNYMFCQDGICTHWCNHSYQLPGDPDHECPVGYYCKFYRDADSVGHCQWHPLGGTKPIGETCTYSDECRAYFDGIWSTCQDGRCSDACSSTLDCRDTGPDTSDWICQASAFQSAKFDHGVCSPPLGSGQPGDSCAGYTDCIDGRCYDNGDGSYECRNMCCTEAECAGGRICWFWEGGEAPSTIKLCMDKGSTGSDGFGTACTGSDFFDSSCSTGLCVDVGEGERCNRLCCRDTDCPAGYVCDFAFIVLRQANKNSRVRACVPEIAQLPDSGPEDICLPGDRCGLTIAVSSFPAHINGDNTDYTSYFNPHGDPMTTCTPPYNYYGRDVIYEIVVPDGSTLDATMDPTSADLGVYILDVCDPDFAESNCLDGDDDGGGGAAESVSWTNDTGSEATVYLVVDGWNGEQIGSYTLDIDLTP